MQKALLRDLVQHTRRSVPALDRLQKLLALLRRANVAQLHHDQRALVLRARRQQHVRVQLPRRRLHAVAEVLDERGGGRWMEVTRKIIK